MKKIFISRGMIVGIFIFLGLIIFLTAVFTIGNQQKAFEKTVTIKVIFDDVNGLQPGNNVWLSGVKIGTVKKINFHGNTQVEIIMNIDRAASRHIQRNAMAKISSDGFIGNKIVVIYGGTNEAENINSGDYLQSEKNTGTDDILSTLQKNNINLLAITDNLKIVSEKIKDGKGTLGKLINDP
ncbi:MAG: MCE family protein, partial [Bacteroidetes bacterium]|nr:MCE family protein [Bacteroidota bacterium]